MVCIIKGMKSSDLIKIIERDGWLRCHQKGSYCQFKHPMKAGRVTIPHPRKDLPIKTVASIFKQAGTNKEDIK